VEPHEPLWLWEIADSHHYFISKGAAAGAAWNFLVESPDVSGPIGFGKKRANRMPIRQSRDLSEASHHSKQDLFYFDGEHDKHLC
jgi:hypothetical protein